jgi:hypothetical protein
LEPLNAKLKTRKLAWRQSKGYREKFLSKGYKEKFFVLWGNTK